MALKQCGNADFIRESGLGHLAGRCGVRPGLARRVTDLVRQDSTAPALAKSVADLTAASLAPQTKVAYGSALKGLEEFRAGAPLTDDLIAAYITELHNNGRAPAVAALVLCAVKLQANLLDGPRRSDRAPSASWPASAASGATAAAARSTASAGSRPTPPPRSPRAPAHPPACAMPR